MMKMDGNDLRKDFPIFSKRPELVYFDNACTTLKPKAVIDAMTSYYSEYSACAGRSSHSLAKEVDAKIEKARETIAKFIGATNEEVVWTKNTTDAINLVANTSDFSKRKKIVLSELEHHSSILPFQKLAEAGKVKLEFVRAGKDGTLSDESWKNAIDRDTALVVIHHTNNSIGTRSNLQLITKLAHENGALVLVDGAQGVPHAPVDFKKENYDFLAFSGHKMLGPTGIGCLVGRKELVEKMTTYEVGGGTVEEVHLSVDGKISVKYLTNQHRLEAGIQNYSGMLGLAAACDYLSRIGMKNVETQEHKLAKKMHATLTSIPNIEIYGPEYTQTHGALFSFNIKKAKPHETALLLDRAKIMVRSGVFCAQPALEALGQKDGAVRVSLYIYNTEKEIEFFGEKLGKIAKLYR